MTLNKEWKNLLELAEKATSTDSPIQGAIAELVFDRAVSPDVIKRLIGEMVELQEAASDYLSGHACIHEVNHEERLRKLLEKGKS